MQTEMDKTTTWATIHTERAALAVDLADLADSRWGTPSLCEGWSVEEALAHLTAGALETRWRWIASVLRARFDFDKHNRRRITENLGKTPRSTLENFHAAIPSAKGPSGHHWAWLGEIVIHGEDIRRPLGIAPATPPEVAREVASHFAVKNFTVPSKTHVAGLQLVATDSDFRHGEGLDVTGPTLSLVLAMAGREAHLADLEGSGVEQLAAAISATVA